MASDPQSPHVLHLGWAHEAAESLAALGARTTFVVKAADVATVREHPGDSPFVVVPDPDRLDDVIAGLARAGIDLDSFDVVCTADELPVVPAAALARTYLRRSWLPLDTAIALRDKVVQKTLIRDAGLPVTRFWTINGIDELGEQATGCVVKPLAGAGTQLTYAISDAATREHAVRAITESGQPGPWLVEEFVPGDELHIDGVVRDGELRFLAVCRYLRNVIDIQRGYAAGSIVMDPLAHNGLYRTATDLAAAALTAIGHTDGVFHMEAFEQGDSLVFSECAGRLSGGLVKETLIAKFGVDLFEQWARAVLGLPCGIPVDVPAHTESFGWTMLNAAPGKLTAIPSPEDLRARPGVIEAQVNLKPGDTVPDTTTASHLRVARVLITGENERSVAEDLRAFTQWFQGQVRVAA